MSVAAVSFVCLMTTAVGQASTPVAAPAPASVQAAPTQGQSDALPVSLQHIRKALDEESAPDPDAPKLRVDASNVPVFRTHAASTGVRLSSLLDNGTNVGAFVRPPNGLYHYEFTQMVTADAVKGCGRLTSSECVQSYSSQFLTGLLWQRATQRKRVAEPPRPSSSAPAPQP